MVYSIRISHYIIITTRQINGNAAQYILTSEMHYVCCCYHHLFFFLS